MASQGMVRGDFSDLIIMVGDQHRPDKNFEYLRDATVHSFELMNRLFKEKKVQILGGTQIERFVNIRENGSAQFVLPTQTYEPGMVATMENISVPWKQAHADWTIARFEVQSSRGPEEWASLVKSRRMTGQMDLSLLIETALWETYDSTSATSPFGIPYWVGPFESGQTAAGAFQSTGPYDNGTSAYLTSVGGLSTSTAARWKGWTANWGNATGKWTATSRKRCGRMFRNLQFESPMLTTDLAKARFEALRLYTNQTVLEELEEAAIQQNDQVGGDLGRYQGRTLYRSLPINWQSQLDTADANARGANPFYMINFAYLYPVVRDGDFFRTQTFPAPQYQPDVVTSHIDISYNILSDNRQLAGGVISYVA